MTDVRTSPTRSHQHTLEIAASPGEVWQAITDPAELVNWFPLGAECTPGAGGEILYRWGELAGRCRILEWEPPRHLRTGWMEAPAGAATPESARLAVDWTLEGKGGRTVLRLVHSGFGRDAAWDKEYDGTNRGWEFELRALKHYLERHRGRTRHAFWVRRSVALTPAEVWERFRRPGPFFRSVSLDSLAAGGRYGFQLANGDELSGTVLLNAPPLEFAGTVDTLGDGMLRFGFEDCMGGPEAHAWVATWGLSGERTRALEARWNDALRQAFP